MRKADHWFLKVFWLAIGIFVAIHAYQLGLGQFHRPGPGFIFFCAALFLILLAAIDIGAALAEKNKTAKTEKSIWLNVRWPMVLWGLFASLAYVYFLHIVGFAVSTFLLMLFLFKVLEPTKWRVAIMGGIIATVAFYFLFKIFLLVPFPKGYVGI